MIKVNREYLKIELAHLDKDKLASIFHHCLYCFLRMLFELFDPPCSLQRTIEMMLPSAAWQFAFVLLYNVVVFNKTPQLHIDDVHKVRSLLRSADAILKLMQCKFITDRMDYLGHLSCVSRFKLASHMTDFPRALQKPTIPTDRRSYFAIAIFRRFFSSLARVTTPQNQLLRKYQPATINPSNKGEIYAMRLLKNALISPSIMVPPNSREHIALETNACNVQIGHAILQKRPNNIDKLGGYLSRSNTNAEK